MSEMHDPYEDQLSAARYRAERDQARQECEHLQRKVECLEDDVENLDLELGEAKDRLRDRSSDTTASAYDLLPQEDRDAIAWVREHGGLDSVKKLLDWVVGHCSTRQQLDFDFWLSGCVMHELGFEEDMADLGEVERRLRDRLMPEGMSWPVFEDGEPVRIGDVVSDVEVRSVVFRDGGILLSDCTSVPGWGTWRSYREPIKRPSKVLDGDGVEIYKGRIAYGTRGRKYRVTELCEYEPSIVHAQAIDDGELGDEFIAANTGLNSYQLDASKLTHERPVLDADGVPVELGDDLYSLDGMDRFHVSAIDKKSGRIATEAMFALKWADPVMYTHRAPAIAGDGKPLLKHETVYEIETGERYFVTRLFDGMTEPDFPEHTVECRKYEDVVTHMFRPSQLTHERPDSWERLEEDAEKDPCDYFGFDGEETCGKCPASGKNCEQTMARDLVRRCRALAERGE